MYFKYTSTPLSIAYTCISAGLSMTLILFLSLKKIAFSRLYDNRRPK